jgi:hypothetical protein
MPFSKKIQKNALIKSHRRCSVCHEFAGRAVNVHHIIQEADGGPNTIDNAIVLCLRCHSEAGHYNPRHPIGIKYSPEELRQHRDKWIKLCESNPPPTVTAIADVLWKRIYTSQDLHKYALLFKLKNNTEKTINNWKINLCFPSRVPVDLKNVDVLDTEFIDESNYIKYVVAGDTPIFPGEKRLLVDNDFVSIHYSIDHDIYYDCRSGNWSLKWQFYGDSSQAIKGEKRWDEMHHF